MYAGSEPPIRYKLLKQAESSEAIISDVRNDTCVVPSYNKSWITSGTRQGLFLQAALLSF